MLDDLPTEIVEQILIDLSQVDPLTFWRLRSLSLRFYGIVTQLSESNDRVAKALCTSGDLVHNDLYLEMTSRCQTECHISQFRRIRALNEIYGETNVVNKFGFTI